GFVLEVMQRAARGADLLRAVARAEKLHCLAERARRLRDHRRQLAASLGQRVHLVNGQMIRRRRDEVGDALDRRREVIEVFAVDDTELGGWFSNGALTATIIIAVLLTIYKDKIWKPLPSEVVDVEAEPT